jgi:hypothetical protein
MSCSRKNRMTGKQLYEAIHPCMMKLALINEKKFKKTTTSRYHSSIVKTTSHVENAEKVPNFAARWCLIRKYLIQSTASNHEENNESNISKMKIQNTPIVE